MTRFVLALLLCWLALPLRAAPAAVILSDPALPHTDAALAGALAQTLRAAGYAPGVQTAAQVARPDALTPERCALLVLPQARALPLSLAAPVTQYLHAGGHLLALGVPAWQAPLVQGSDGRWVTTAEYAESQALTPPPHPVFDFHTGADLSGWRRTSDRMETPTREETTTASVHGRTAGALHAVIPDLSGWDTFLSPVLTEPPFPDGRAMTVFSAKGGPRTHALSVEWDERDGSRWIAVVPLTTRWQRYSLPPAAFHSWQNSGARAAQGFHPENAARLSVGLAFSHTGTVGGAHEYWISEFGTASAAEVPAVPDQASVEALDTVVPGYKFFPVHGSVRLLGLTLFQGHSVLVPGDRLRLAPEVGALRLATEVAAIQHTVPLRGRSGGAGISASAQARWASAQADSALKSRDFSRQAESASPFPPLFSMQPRPTGAGFAKGRAGRWIPLLTAADARTGEWRGVPATLLLHTPGRDFSGGAWAAFAVADPAFYHQPAVQRAIGQVARRMLDGLFLLEGGAEFDTLFPGQPVRLGAQVADLSPEAGISRQGAVRLRVTTADTQTAWQQTWPVQAGCGESVTRESVWTPPSRWPASGYQVTTELLEKGQVVDRLQHALHVWTPPARPDWITIRPDGHFYLHGRLWRANGVNYMPSSGIGQNDNALFEFWLSRAAYDPEAVERDLTHIESLGMNAVSVFLYGEQAPSQNLLDLLRRCRDHHLRVNMSLRPGVSSYLQEADRDGAERRAWDTFQGIITRYRLAQNDTIFAYEIDWEPDFARYGRQKRTDGDWAKWVNAHYGSVAAAEQAWGVPAPRDAQGSLTGPSGAQLQSAGGPDTQMVAAYRRFLDDWLAETYGLPARRIRALAPHQSVSFRMTGASDPLWGDGGESYQFEGLARALDFLAPESYGQIGHDDGDLAALFRIAYARSVAPHEPALWAETGMSVWAGAGDDPDALRTQGTYYARFYELARQSGADGIFWWWYPGGYRVSENSDFGLINPDGTDRPATAAIRRFGPAFRDAPAPPAPDVWLDYDRDQHPDGVVGVFRALKAPFAAALAQGHRPGLRATRQP